ncbi:o-succinylbenzoate--CoA ligase [Thalassoporum mexicanum PCC 7367]|uniref:AMP-dependent synthetase/ligase n=1 Tax=Thalassoporum mexicanum TaxID=3457544 RepID=UPI00029FCD18|nr:AMP-binding protein [Pseudanabaena sp. PCC 7367]AFY68472.1 o-succinylbenzoate--CoA ligase [Pseudanabaena sp. PCC 7367]
MTITQNPKPLDHSEANNLWQVWQKTVAVYPDIIALHDPHAKPEVKLTYQETFSLINQFGAGLRSLGVKAGDKVALIADNSSRWLIADQGILAIGAANATRSSQAERTELLYIVEHSDSTALVVENLATLQKLQPDLQDLPIKLIVLLSDEEPPEGAYNYQQVCDRGVDKDLGDPQITRDTLATLIYTSGTSGKPKGVMLTHGNILTQVRGGTAMVKPFPGDRILSILPTWHSYERSCEYFLFSQGVTQIYTNLRKIKNDLATFKPQYMLAVPRLWESIYEGIQRKFDAESATKRKLINFLLNASNTYIKARRVVNGLSLTGGNQLKARLTMFAYAPLYWLAKKLVFDKIRAGIGGEFKYICSGGGALQPHLELFYEAAQIEILVGYGLTETSPMVTARRPERNLRTTSGIPLPDAEIKIVDPETKEAFPPGKRGLVMARGPMIMQGYYKNPEATNKAIDADGWFNTGDLGFLTHKNDLTITGRAKDTIVLSNGENIEPLSIEDACSSSTYIDQIMLVGQDQRQLGALIVPNLKALEVDGLLPADSELAESIDLLNQDKIRNVFRSELTRKVQDRPGQSINDRIGPFEFLPEPFDISNGMMTQTFKVKRNVVTERYRDLIDQMFTKA